MATTSRLRAGIVRQFHRPHGPVGAAVGWIMSHRRSNVARNRWAVELLDVRPGERALDLGCGPGIAVAALAERVGDGGLAVGVDHSATMVRQARRRNAAGVRTGRARLVTGAVEDLVRAPEALGGPFDAVLAVNAAGLWPRPAEVLARIRTHVLRPGGRIALVSQPRCPGATAADTERAGDELDRLLAEAGFVAGPRATLALDPPAVCTQATAPG